MSRAVFPICLNVMHKDNCTLRFSRINLLTSFIAFHEFPGILMTAQVFHRMWYKSDHENFLCVREWQALCILVVWVRSDSQINVISQF